MEPINVEFTFSADSFGKAQMYIMYLYLKNGMFKWILLLAALAYIGTEFFWGEGNWFRLANSLTWLPLFAGVWYVVFKWLSRRNFTKYPMMQHPIRYVFSAEQIGLVTSVSDSSIQWEAIQKVEEARDFFLIYQSALSVSPLLKSGFQNEAEQERFRTLLREKQLFKG